VGEAPGLCTYKIFDIVRGGRAKEGNKTEQNRPGGSGNQLKNDGRLRA